MLVERLNKITEMEDYEKHSWAKILVERAMNNDEFCETNLKYFNKKLKKMFLERKL